jgi:outer membrane protein
MKKFLLVVFVLVIGLTGFAQKQKFGHVDSEAIFTAMPEKDQAAKAVEQFARQLEEQLMSLNKELEQKYTEYMEKAETFSPSIKQMREEELTNLQQRIQAFQMRAQQDLQEKEQELLAPIYQKITDAIKIVGEENGFLYVFDVNSFYYHSSESVDLTEQVKSRLTK